jgi:hypothetical protein
MTKYRRHLLAEAQDAGRVGTAFPPHFLLIAVMSLTTA